MRTKYMPGGQAEVSIAPVVLIVPDASEATVNVIEVLMSTTVHCMRFVE